jgi:hypothetical protein
MANTATEMQVSKAAVDELRSLSSSDAERVVTFLQNLADNPYDRTLIGTANAKGDLFASPATDKLYVYWSFDMDNHLPELDMPPKINVLGLARKRANHSFAPLLSVASEKLRPA